MEKLSIVVRGALRVLLLKWYGIGLSLVSFFYGVRLYMNTEILSEQLVYQKFSELMDLRIIALAFMIMGATKFLGIVLNNRYMRIVGVTSLAVLWTIIGVTFLPTPNTVAILTLGYAWISFGISIREDYR